MTRSTIWPKQRGEMTGEQKAILGNWCAILRNCHSDIVPLNHTYPMPSVVRQRKTLEWVQATVNRPAFKSILPPKCGGSGDKPSRTLLSGQRHCRDLRGPDRCSRSARLSMSFWPTLRLRLHRISAGYRRSISNLVTGQTFKRKTLEPLSGCPNLMVPFVLQGSGWLPRLERV